MKTHIALVGSQPIPVYLGIKWSGAIDKLILVCSEQTTSEAKRLAICCKNIPHEIICCDSVNLHEIEKCACQIRNQIGEGEIHLNLTSGTKPWTLVFYKTFSKYLTARFILVDQNNRIQDLDTHEEYVEHIPTELRFLLYGARLTHFTKFSEYTEADIKAMRAVEKQRRNNYSAFNELTVGKNTLHEHECNAQLKDGSFVKYNQETNTVVLSLYKKYVNHNVEIQLTSPHVADIVFNSGWFELKTALELSKNEHAQDIWLNCEFAAEDNVAKNEIDIVVNMGNKLLCVECKTQVRDITAIDKFNSAIRNFSGTSTKGVFVINDAPSLRNGIYRRAMEKCKDNNILTFNFGIYHRNNLLPALNATINQNLNQINKR